MKRLKQRTLDRLFIVLFTLGIIGGMVLLIFMARLNFDAQTEEILFRHSLTPEESQYYLSCLFEGNRPDICKGLVLNKYRN